MKQLYLTHSAQGRTFFNLNLIRAILSFISDFINLVAAYLAAFQTFSNHTKDAFSKNTSY